MTRPFDKDDPEQIAYERVCSIWLTGGSSDREKYAYRDGHHAGWKNAIAFMAEKDHRKSTDAAP